MNECNIVLGQNKDGKGYYAWFMGRGLSEGIYTGDTPLKAVESLLSDGNYSLASVVTEKTEKKK